METEFQTKAISTINGMPCRDLHVKLMLDGSYTITSAYVEHALKSLHQAQKDLLLAVEERDLVAEALRLLMKERIEALKSNGASHASVSNDKLVKLASMILADTIENTGG